MKRNFVISILAVLFIWSYSFATVINVPADYPTIQQGIDASADGDTVLVQPGTYVENINFNGHNIILGSLYLITGDSSAVYNTVIDGNQNGTVVTFENGESEIAEIIGFRIANGLSLTNGGGLYCHFSNPKIHHNIVAYCEALNFGGGIYCVNSNPFIEMNMIEINTAICGGAIYCHESSPIIKKNNIYGGFAFGGNNYGLGGAIYCGNDSYPKLYENFIFYNYASSNQGSKGGGIYIVNSTIDIFNCVFSYNDSDYGGGIFMHNANATIINNVFTENDGFQAGGAIYCDSNTALLMKNTIVYRNWHPQQNIYVVDSSLISITYSCIQAGWDGIGNIDQNPKITSGYHIASIECGSINNSPCIDAGDPNILDSLLDCSWGLGGLRSDMGAYGGGDSLVSAIFDEYIPIPGRFMLLQNYPNPFNAQTTIRFMMPESEHVIFTIYDLLGRRVETLLDEYRQAGIHAVTFDASHLSSGVYFYRLRAGERIETKRMLLLK